MASNAGSTTYQQEVPSQYFPVRPSEQAVPGSQLSPLLEGISEQVSKVALKAMEMPITGKSVNSAYAVGDWTWAVRTVVVDIPAAAGLQVSKDSFFYQAVGITTAFSSFLGALGAVRSASGIMHAQEIGDGEGAVESGIMLSATIVQTAGGTAMLAYRPLALTTAAMGVNASSISAPTLLGRVTYGVGQLGNLVFGAFYALLGVLGGWGLYQQIKFRIQYEKADDKVAFLKEQLSVTSKEHNKILSANDKAMIKEAKRMLPKASDVKLNKQEWSAFFDAAGDEELARVGRAFRMHKATLKAEAQLKRVASGACIPMIRAIADKQPIEITDNEKTALVNKVEKAWNRKFVINALVTLFGIAGLATTIAMFIFTGGIGAFVVMALTLLAVIIPMSIVDTYSMCIALKDGSIGKYDKAYLIVSSVICVLAMAVSIAMTSLFSFGIMPIAFTLLCGAMWLGLNAVTYYHVDKAQKAKVAKGKEMNPLQDIVQNWANEHRRSLTTVK